MQNTSQDSAKSAPVFPPPKEKDFSGKKILVVEDNADLLDLWKELFRKIDARAELLTSGQAALQRAMEGFEPDLLMTDYQLLDMDGIELIEKLRKLKPGLKCLLVTGNTTDEFRRKIPTDVRLLLKPVRLHILKDTLEQIFFQK